MHLTKKPVLLTLALLLVNVSFARGGDLEFSDPARGTPPPAHAIGTPSRAANLDALPGFQKPPAGYGEVAFYWWMGDPLTRERLTWQLDQLAGKGVAGLQINYCHTDKGGLAWGLSMPSDPPLFSTEWWGLFDWFIGAAKQRGMAVSLSDYTLGIGQGWCLDEMLRADPDLLGSLLHGDSRDVDGGQRVNLQVPAGTLAVTAYRLDGDKLAAGLGVDLRNLVGNGAFQWDAPAGRWRIAMVRSERVPNSLDPMNLKSGPAYAKSFFGRFEDRHPGEGGKGLNCFFSDELEFRIRGNLWNARFAEEFRRRKGYDLVPELPALFMDIGPRTPKVRLDYSDVKVSLTEEGFFKPVYEWHQQRGMIFGCDHGGRGRDVTEFGDYFRTQRWNQGPGCDQPGLACDTVKNKVASSIAHLYQRPRVWLEGYYGSGWGTSSAQIANATFSNFLQGQNLLTLHGLYYSTHGGWWEWAPPCNHFRMPYWQHMDSFMQSVQRLSYLLSQGHHRCDVAVLYPVAPSEAGMGGGEAVNAAFSLGEHLYARSIDFDYMDFESLDRATIADHEIQVSGERYRVLVLPAMRAIRHSTLRKALEFYRAGGIVVSLGALPEASDRAGRGDGEVDAMVKEIFGVTASEAKSPAGNVIHKNDQGGQGQRADSPGAVCDGVARSFSPDFAVLSGGQGSPYFMHRRVGPRDIYAVYGVPRGAVCFFRAKGAVERWNIWTGGVEPQYEASADRDGTRIRMPGGDVQLIVFSDAAPGPLVEQTDLDEIASISRKDGRLVVEGFSAAAGARSASVRADGNIVKVTGEAPAPPATLTIEGPWEFELKPALDNRWGDFHWPPTPTLIGAEARRFQYADETSAGVQWQLAGVDDSKWQTVSSSFGPRFWKLGPIPDGADLSRIEAKLASAGQVDPAAEIEISGKKFRWRPYEYSLRYGVEVDPGHEGHHGLKESVSDEFIALGRLQQNGTGSSFGREAGGSRYLLWTSLAADKAGDVQMLTGGQRPAAIWVGGQSIKLSARTVTLRAGANPLLIRYDSPGRSYVIFDRALSGAAAEPAGSAMGDFSPGAAWIWSGAEQRVEDRWFRRHFDLSAIPPKAILRITADNRFRAWINGREVGSGSDWGRIDQFDVASLLKAGANVIAIAARNDGGLAGVIAELTVTDAAGKTIRIATDADWRCAAEERPEWTTPQFDDTKWSAAVSLAGFEESEWFKHPSGPPRLAPAPAPAPAPASPAVAAGPAPAPAPLAMSWYGRSTVVPFDPRPRNPQDRGPAGWYRFTAPPGLRAMTFSAFGSVRAWVNGEASRVEQVGAARDGARQYRIALDKPARELAKVALRIEQDRGCYGGSAIPEPIALDCGAGELALGDWSALGVLANYSGGAWYRKVISLSEQQVAGRVTLDLGGVASSAEVRVNGQAAGVRLCPPWQFDVTRFVKPGENRVEVLVYNTLANHYATIPTRYRGSPTSGLLGPVRIISRPVVVLKE